VDELVARIEETLASAGAPLTVGEIAERLSLTAHDIDRVIWGEPDRFVWQPGHRWTVGAEKARPATVVGRAAEQDAREGPLAPRRPVELRATTLASGVTLRVSRRPLDTHAVFTVKSSGNVVELILNSGHELFAELPMPFDGGSLEGDYRALAEILLEAWALFEDSIPGGPSRRAAEDTRLLWGRRIIELLRESDGSA
jgi:hypothetical protein